MKSRNFREGHYCGCMASPVGKRRYHVRANTGQISSGAATKIVTARLVSKAEEKYQMTLVAKIKIKEGGNAWPS
jgi:hypothetical protein